MPWLLLSFLYLQYLMSYPCQVLTMMMMDVRGTKCLWDMTSVPLCSLPNSVLTNIGSSSIRRVAWVNVYHGYVQNTLYMLRLIRCVMILMNMAYVQGTGGSTSLPQAMLFVIALKECFLVLKKLVTSYMSQLIATKGQFCNLIKPLKA